VRGRLPEKQGKVITERIGNRLRGVWGGEGAKNGEGHLKRRSGGCFKTEISPARKLNDMNISSARPVGKSIPDSEKEAVFMDPTALIIGTTRKAKEEGSS